MKFDPRCPVPINAPLSESAIVNERDTQRYDYDARLCDACGGRTMHRKLSVQNDTAWQCQRPGHAKATGIKPTMPAPAPAPTVPDAHPRACDECARLKLIVANAIGEVAELGQRAERAEARVNAVEARLDAVRQAADRKPLHAVTAATLDLVAAERQRQDVKWGRSPGHWPNGSGVKLAVLVEEVGEVARALLEEEGDERLLEELVQVATVAVAWAETLAAMGGR